jgi:hypothetical protein
LAKVDLRIATQKRLSTVSLDPSNCSQIVRKRAREKIGQLFDLVAEHGSSKAKRTADKVAAINRRVVNEVSLDSTTIVLLDYFGTRRRYCLIEISPGILTQTDNICRRTYIEKKRLLSEKI